MSTSELAKLRAPVAYTDVRARINTVRVVFGLVLAGLAITGLVQDLSPAAGVLVFALYMAADGLWRRGHGESAVPMLLTDTFVFAAIGLLKGDVNLWLSVTFLYILTGALLLLPLTRAAAVISVALLVGITVLLLAPIGDPVISETRSNVFDIVSITLMSLLVGSLLYGAVQALHASTQRHRQALSAERRAVELKDEFVSMVSHEFRTPLTSIAGFSETLRANWPDLEPEEIAEFLIIMRQEAHHLSDLVEDILVIPRIEAGRLRLRPQEFDLAAEIAATSRLVFADTGKEINTYIPTGVIVNADRGRVGQILRNLFDNARKYGGDAVQIDGEASTDTYTITIADNGPGIPEPDWERIFEHFEQGGKGNDRPSEGVGLGLPIARQLARAMGGDVWYAARFPTGASFLFSIRLARIIPDGGEGEVPATEATEPTEV
ncbi:MAG: HAMP domain-containing sensor histidine kinase [Acidimicrobiia bacterium]|nr:HAMP domain-containing sensor histidine kinase [Acidimicrobiia bacterium]